MEKIKEIYAKSQFSGDTPADMFDETSSMFFFLYKM